MPSKCKAIDDTVSDIEQELKNLDSYISEVKNQSADPTITPEHQKFDQAVKGKATKIKNRKSTMDKPQDIMTDEDVEPILENKFKSSEERERVRLVHQLSTLMNNDADFNATADEIILDSILNLEFQQLRDKGTPVVFDDITGKPNLYTVPLEKIRIIYAKLAPHMDISEDGKTRGLIDSNLAFEFYLPKNVIRSAATQSAMKFKNALLRWRNKVNAYVASYSGPIDVDSRLEKELLHPDTGLPIIDNLKRSKAGFSEILNVLSSSLYSRLLVGRNQNGVSQIADLREMYKVVSDLMHGRAIIIDKGDDFGKVYMFEKKVPMGKYKDTGDTRIDWKGYEFTSEERQEIEKKTGKPFNAGSYVVPYITGKTEMNPEGVHLNLNEEAAGDKGENLALLVDATLQHMDVILKEAGLDFQEALLESQTRWQKLMSRFKNNKIEMPKEIFGEYQQLEEDLIALESQNAQLKGKVQFRERLALKDGSFIEVRRYRRYYPTLYHRHSMGEALYGGIENINNEIQLLSARMVPNPEATPEEQKIIDSATDRAIDLTKARRHLEMALERFLNSDAIYEGDSKMPDAIKPFEKHFKSLSNYIPYEYVRNDEGVVNDYIRRVSRNVVKTQLMLDMLDTYADVDSPTFRNYLVNQYRKAFGSVDAEGSLLGVRFSTRDLSNVVKVDVDNIKKFFTAARSASVFNNLSGFLTGPLNLVAHVNKAFEVGAQRFFTAFLDANRVENQRAIIRSGILSFQDVIENHIMLNGNEEERRSYRKMAKKWKKAKKEARSVSDAQKAADILHIMKKNNTPIMHSLRTLANWAISGEIRPNIDDSETTKGIKTVLSFKKYVSMSWSEKSVRQTSFQMGVNIAKEGWGVDANHPLAIDMGIRMVEELDFSLGQEGVGDMFGNELMQWLMHIRVWSVQRMSYGKDAYLNAWRSVKPYSDEEGIASKIGNNAKASWEYSKALMTTFMGGGIVMASPLIAGLTAGFQTGNVLGGLGGAVAGFAGAKAVQKITGSKKRADKLRLDNPDLAKSTQMLLFHGAFAMMYDFIVFNANMNFGTYAGIIALFKKVGWKTGAHSIGSSLSAPELRFAFMAMAMLGKAAKEDDELDKHDFVKLVGSVAGIGWMQIMYLAMTAFDDTDALIKGQYDRQKDYSRQFKNLNFPKFLKPVGLEAETVEGGIKKLKYWYRMNQ